MKNKKLNAFVATTLFCLTAGAMAQGISKPEYKAEEDKIESDYKLGKTQCEAYSSNAKDICLAEVKGRESISKAELDAKYKPSPKAQRDVVIARAEAVYKVSTEKCDDKSGGAKDVCLKEAKATFNAVKADAKALN